MSMKDAVSVIEFASEMDYQDVLHHRGKAASFISRVKNMCQPRAQLESHMKPWDDEAEPQAQGMYVVVFGTEIVKQVPLKPAHMEPDVKFFVMFQPKGEAHDPDMQ